MITLMKYMLAFLISGFGYTLAEGQVSTKPCANIVNDTNYPITASIDIYPSTTEEIVDKMHGKFNEQQLASKTIAPGDVAHIEADQESLKSTLTLSIDHKGSRETLILKLHGYGCQDFAVRSTGKSIYAFEINTLRHFINEP